VLLNRLCRKPRVSAQVYRYLFHHYYTTQVVHSVQRIQSLVIIIIIHCFFLYVYIQIPSKADTRVVSIFLYSAVPFVSTGAWPCVFSFSRSFGFHAACPHTVIINSWRYASLYTFLYNILCFRPSPVTACVVVATAV